MSASDWSRSRKSGKGNGRTDANTIPIGVIVAHYGGEVREGKNLPVRCVLHNDSRKSAVIDTKDNLYYCHTCGKGGNAVNIISIKENMEFKDALARAIEIITGSGGSIQQGSKRRSGGISRRSWDI
jgi:DNA primase